MIRIFIGCAANHEDAESQAVLEYTLNLHATRPLDITWMKLSRDPSSPFYCDRGKGWNTVRWATPFSGFRWVVPELCEFKGRAVYMDSDIVVNGDIAQLYDAPLAPGKVVMAKGGSASWRFCVSLWDCAAAKKYAPTLDHMYGDRDLHHRMVSFYAHNKAIVQAFSPDQNWNCIDGEDYSRLDDHRIKAIHYSAMRHQPHLRHAVPRLAKLGRKHWFDGKPANHWRPDLITLFDRLLKQAAENGYPVSRYETDPLYGPYQKASVANIAEPSWKRARASA